MTTQSHLWIIDDDDSIRWVLQKALEAAGFLVTSFDNANTILDKLKLEEPDAIITDVRMPGIDGLELLSHLSRDHPDLPVIIMTAHTDLDSAVSAYQGGAFEYLPKPFDIDEAVAVAQRACVKNSLMDHISYRTREALKLSVLRLRCRKFFAPSVVYQNRLSVF